MQQKLFCPKDNKEQDCTYYLCQWQVSNLWQGQIHIESNVIHKHVHTNFSMCHTNHSYLLCCLVLQVWHSSHVIW